MVIVALFCLTGFASSPIRNFDEWGDINCEDEMARLDNLAVTLQSVPQDKAALLFYGGQRFRGRLPKRGEAAVRAARLKTYLVNRRGIPADQILMIDGGFMKQWFVQIWLVPPGAELPQPNPMIPVEKIKFRKGKARARDFRCEI